jgi:quercetin dioxygenase-like cupin family protein
MVIKMKTKVKSEIMNKSVKHSAQEKEAPAPKITADLADYQKDAIVSRTLIDKKAGTVTFFSFDEGQGLSEHTAPYDAMVQIIDGKSEITIAGKKNLVKVGEMIILPANKPHALRAINKFKMMLTMIRE